MWLVVGCCVVLTVCVGGIMQYGVGVGELNTICCQNLLLIFQNIEYYNVLQLLFPVLAVNSLHG